MSLTSWALTLAYWLHMLATVTWIGGLAALSLFVLPAARRSLEAESYVILLAAIQRRLDPLAWFSLIILAASGLFQMSSNPNYDGFLKLENTWTLAILVKHMVFLAMAGISAYLTWSVLPGLRRIALRQALARREGREATDDAGQLGRQETRLLLLNLVLGVLVLALTALARAS
jgi:uncharacterized membrane protein